MGADHRYPGCRDCRADPGPDQDDDHRRPRYDGSGDDRPLSRGPRLRRPSLEGLLASVGRLSAGDYANPVAGQDRADETGRRGACARTFRGRLADSNRLEAEAADARKQGEADRSRTEGERNENARVQQFVVSELKNALATLSAGDLSFRVTRDFPGEYAELKQNFNGAVASLEETLRMVSQAVANIDGGTSEISSGANDLSHRTEQQAAQIEETAAALNELDRTGPFERRKCQDSGRRGQQRQPGGS